MVRFRIWVIMMNLRDKVYALRADFKKSRIFYINNPAVSDQDYFGVFATADGSLHYDFGSLSDIQWYRAERLKSRICKKYNVLYKSEFLRLWFDYEFWLYCLSFADTAAEEQHYQHKINKIIE